MASPHQNPATSELQASPRIPNNHTAARNGTGVSDMILNTARLVLENVEGGQTVVGFKLERSSHSCTGREPAP